MLIQITVQDKTGFLSGEDQNELYNNAIEVKLPFQDTPQVGDHLSYMVMDMAKAQITDEPLKKIYDELNSWGEINSVTWVCSYGKKEKIIPQIEVIHE